jgi:hypothetical protein
MSVARRLLLWTAILWTTLILIGTLLPARSLPETGSGSGFSLLDLPYFDKAVHFALFFGFGVLWILATGAQSRARVLIAGLALAVLTELLQTIPAIGREAGWEDVAADALGLALALLVAPRLAESVSRVWGMRHQSAVASTP